MNPNTASFPYAPSTDFTLTVASNNAQTTLNGGINSSVTTIPVANTASFIAPCIIVIDGEIILAEVISGDSFTNCIRGFASSTATSHSNSAPVYGYIVSYHHNQVAAEINSISNQLFLANFSGLKTNENLLLWSEAFNTGGVWSLASGATISNTTGTSPSGAATACTLLEGDTLGTNSVSSNFSSPVDGNPYTFSVYAKYTNNQWLTIGQNVANDTTRRVSFDILNGVLGVQGAIAQGAIVPVGNNWYRCMVATTCNSVTYQSFDICISSANNVVSYVGTETQSVEIWGAQVQPGLLEGVMSYVQTTGATVTLVGGGDLILDEGFVF